MAGKAALAVVREIASYGSVLPANIATTAREAAIGSLFGLPTRPAGLNACSVRPRSAVVAQTTPGASCSIAYRTPAGTSST